MIDIIISYNIFAKIYIVIEANVRDYDYDVVKNRTNCKIDIINFADETLTNVFEMKNVKCNNNYLNMLKLKIDFRKIRKHFVT